MHASIQFNGVAIPDGAGQNGVHEGTMLRHSALSMAFDRESISSQQPVQEQEISLDNGEPYLPAYHGQTVQSNEYAEDKVSRKSPLQMLFCNALRNFIESSTES